MKNVILSSLIFAVHDKVINKGFLMMMMLQESLDPSPVVSFLCRPSRVLAPTIASFGLRVEKILDRPTHSSCNTQTNNAVEVPIKM